MGETPPTPFPDSIAEFTVPLPIPYTPPGERNPINEISCQFVKKEERHYSATPTLGGDTETIYAAIFKTDTDLGELLCGLAMNAESGLGEEMTTAAVMAYARWLAMVMAYYLQSIPQPDNPGITFPLYKAAVDPGDGSMRLRGFCSGLHYVYHGDLEEMDSYVEKVFYVESPPGPVD